jgi:hypothetical protein
VCPLLYNYSDIYSDYRENNGVFQGYKGPTGHQGYQGYQGISCQSSGHVSLFHLPTRHESGSYAQISNDARGNSVFDFPYFSFQNQKVHSSFHEPYKCAIFSYHFKHGPSSIGPTGAEIWPVKGLKHGSSFHEPYKCAVFFNPLNFHTPFSSFHEPYKCADLFNSCHSCICIEKVHIYKHFEHGFSSI